MKHSICIDPQEICVLRLSSIGDVCYAAAVVQAVHNQYPKARITWVIGKTEAALLEGMPGISFVVFDKSQGWRAYQQLRNTMRGKRFDVLLHMQAAFRANMAAICIPADVKIGFDWSRAKEGHALVARHRIPPQIQPHVFEGFQAFARAIGVRDCRPEWQMPYREEDWQWATNRLGGGRVFAISPAASKAERNWDTGSYAALADYAAQRGFQVVLTGGPTEMEHQLAADIQSKSRSNLLNLTGQTTLKQLLCVLKRADVLLAPDTGPAHMAVTVGTPVIGLYAHSNPKRTGPYTYLQYVVEVYHQNLVQQYGKPADQLPWGTRNKGNGLMRQITVDRVMDMVNRVLSQEQICPAGEAG